MYVTKPQLNANQVTTHSTNGARRKGIIKNGFIMTGRPNMIGSLILNNAGTETARMIDLVYLALPTKKPAITRPIVAPEPPMETNHWKNVSGAM